MAGLADLGAMAAPIDSVEEIFPRYDARTRWLSAHDYGFDCEDCNGYVDGRARRFLVHKKARLTLCRPCCDARLEREYVAKNGERRPWGATCPACGMRWNAPTHSDVCESRATRRREKQRADAAREAGSLATKRARELLAEAEELPALGYVYKVFGRGGDLLYVGKTSDPLRRLGQHADKEWWPLKAEVEVFTFPDDATASLAEKFWVRFGVPCFNLQRYEAWYLTEADATEPEPLRSERWAL